MQYAEKDMAEQKISVEYIRMQRDIADVYFRNMREDNPSPTMQTKPITENLFDCGGIFDEYNYLKTQSDDLTLKLYMLDIDFSDKYDAKFELYYKLIQYFPDIDRSLESKPYLATDIKVSAKDILQNWVNGEKSKASIYGGKSEFADMLFLDNTIRWFVLGVI